MKSQNPYFEDVLESILLIEEYLADVTYDDFAASTKLQDSVLYRAAQIGEALNHIGPEERNDYPNIPWREAIGMHNVLIHDYASVNLKRVWDTIFNDYPTLKAAVQDILD